MKYTIDEMAIINLALITLVKHYKEKSYATIDTTIRDSYNDDIKFILKLLEKNYEQFEIQE